MHYIGYPGSGRSVKIDARQHEEILSAKKRISAAIKLESLFSVVAEAFIEYERYHLQISLETTYDPLPVGGMYIFVDRVRQNLNLHVLSLLTAAGVYIEHLQTLVSEAGQTKFDIKTEFAETFDRSFEYRIMQALRNHSVHHALPIGGFSFGGRKLWKDDVVSEETPSRFRHSLVVVVQVKDLTENTKVRKATRQELASLGKDRIDLSYLVRGYISDIATIHEKVRKHTASIEASDLSFYSRLEERYALPILPDTPLAVWQGSQHKYNNICYVDPRSSAHLPELRRRWGGLKSARNQYVSSEITRAPDKFPDSSEHVWIAD